MMIPSYELKDNNLVYTESLENDLIQLYKSVFTNDNVLNELLTPVDFDHMKNDIIAFRSKKSTDDTYHFDAFEDIKNKSLFKAGKAGVGMLANALVDHIRGRMANLRFKNYNIGVGHIIDGETKFDEEYSTEFSNSDINMYAKLYKERTGKELSKSDVESLKKIKISHSLSAVLNGNVDIVKDPFITEGNWNTATTGVGNMLLRAGVHPFHVNAFLRHPVLIEYIEFQNNKESKIVNESGNIGDKFKLHLIRKSSTFNQKINLGNKEFTVAELHKLIYGNYLEQNFNNLQYSTVLDKFKKIKHKQSDNSEKTLSKKQLEDNESEIRKFINIITIEQIDFLANSKTEPGYFPTFKSLLDTENNNLAFDRQVLNVFNILKEDAKKLKKNVDGSTQDVKGIGKSTIELIVKNNIINDLLKTNTKDGDLIGFRDKLVYNKQLSMLGHYTNNVINKVRDVVLNNADLFFTMHPNIINNIDQLSIDLKGEKLLDAKLGEEIEKVYISYVLSGFKGIKTSNEEFKELTSKEFITKFEEFKNSKINRYKILEDLEIVKGEKTKFINMSNRKKDSSTQYDLTKSWLDMLNNDKEMAIDLIKYFFITSCFNMNKGQFFTLIPYEYFIENGINEYLKNVEIKNLDIDFITQFYENNYDNNKFVQKIFPNQIAKTNEGTSKKNYAYMTLDIKAEDAKRYVKNIIKVKDQYENDIEVTELYKLIGFNPTSQPVYIRVPVKGSRDKYGNRTYQYSTNKEVMEHVDNLSEQQLKGIEDVYNQLLPQITPVYGKNVEKTELPEVEETFEVEVNKSEELWNTHQSILEDNGMTQESFTELYNEMGEDYINEYIKKCKS